MRVLILFLGSIFLLISCLTEPKKKELPDYFECENLERYFAGNDSLPVININPNDSFGVIRKSVDSLYQNQKYPPRFRFSINLATLFSKTFIQTSFFDYYPDGFEALIGCGNKRNVLEVLLTSKNKLLVEGELFEIDTLENIVFGFINNYGKDPNYSDNPSIALITLQKDTTVSSKLYYKIVKAIVNGYSNVLDYESNRRYKKTFCKLNTAESDTISEIIPFNFYIEYPETNPYYLNPYLPSDLDLFDDSLFDIFMRGDY
jgi:hypothetical protein